MAKYRDGWKGEGWVAKKRDEWLRIEMGGQVARWMERRGMGG